MGPDSVAVALRSEPLVARSLRLGLDFTWQGDGARRRRGLGEHIDGIQWLECLSTIAGR